MKTRLLSTFLTLLLISILLLPNTFAQDYTQWELPEGATARLGKGGINKIQYSPDNRFLAVASTIGIWIYDAVTLQEALLFAGNTNGISCVSLSLDGKTIASGNDDETIHLWDVDTGKLIKILPGHSRRVWQVAFSPDGKTIASGSGDGTVLLWDVR